MGMIGDGLELPIRYVRFRGPGVDALENRKETLANPITEDEATAIMERNWAEIGDQIMANLKRISQTPLA